MIRCSVQFKLHPFVLLMLLCVCMTLPLHGQLKVPEKTELYRDDVVPRVDVIIDQSSLDFILDPENRESDELFEATFIFNNGTVNDTLERIGFRLRGNTSRNANKKSFKININAFEPGRRYYGVTKINLNGQHNDPTSARAKICADLADLFGIPSLRTNHVALYINGEYYGLYTNTEHVDQNYVKKRFGNKNGNLYKCLFPADLNYKGSNPDAYKEVIFGRRAYELKNNIQADDYTDFANFVSVLNLTPDADLPCELEQVFNVDLYLKTIIFDILTGNWDGPIYNKNNFYLYHNQRTGQFEYIPYDLDNTLGIDWLSRDWGNRNIYEWSRTDEERPIYSRLMGIQEYRDRFTHYLFEILLNIYKEDTLYPYLDDIRDKLKPYLEDDPFFPLDYGFTVEDFEDGFEIPLGFFQTDYGIKEFIQTRLIASFTQLETSDMSPAITNRKNNYPNVSEPIEIQAKVEDNGEIQEVEVCYAFNNGGETCVLMKDDGTQNDGEANDGIYGVLLPPALELGEITYRIHAKDNLDQVSTSPRCGVASINIEEEELKLAINEFMASNNSIITDVNEEYDDWIEIYNYGTTPIYLGDKFLSDNPENTDKWDMPHYTIQGGEYLLFWADDDRNQGTFHTNFKLSKSGEFIGIYDDNEEAIDEIEYGLQESDVSYGRIPNGTGSFITMVPTPESQNIGVNSIEENTLADLIFIAPNPAFDIVEIISPNDILEVRIFDTMGRRHETQKIKNKRIRLPEPPGLYYLEIYTKSNAPITKKVVKR